jgi:hypothetical protein
VRNFLAGVIPLVRVSVHEFKDQLAHGYAWGKHDRKLARVPGFELQFRADGIRVVLLVAGPGVDDRGGDVNAEAQAGQAALPFNPGGQPRTIG